MSLSDDHLRHRDDAAAWVLGALDESEATAFAGHLDACILCQDDVRQLQAAADLLPASAPPIPAPLALKTRIMAEVEAEASMVASAEGRRPEQVRERRRWWPSRLPTWVAAPAAAALLGVGVVAGIGLTGSDGPEKPTVVQASTSKKLPGAKVRLEQHEDGARLVAAGLPTPPAGRVYQVWLQHTNGRIAATTALFAPRANGASTVAVPGGERDDVAKVLVTREVRGGAATPSESPVITVSTA